MPEHETPKQLPLVMEEPRGRKKPPRHLADLTPAERKELLEEKGLPGFRAKQLSTHYFTHHTDDPEQMTDLPKAARDELAAAMLPRLLAPVRTITADRGATLKSVWRLHDGALVESVAAGPGVDHLAEPGELAGGIDPDLAPHTVPTYQPGTDPALTRSELENAFA